jgi:hypothetical protein
MEHVIRGMEPIAKQREDNSAIVSPEAASDTCKRLILQYLDHLLFAETIFWIMSDVHFGR